MRVDGPRNVGGADDGEAGLGGEDPGTHMLFRVDAQRQRLLKQLVVPPSVATVFFEFLQDWDLTERMYNIDMGDFGPAISSVNLQQATWDTLFKVRTLSRDLWHAARVARPCRPGDGSSATQRAWCA